MVIKMFKKTQKGIVKTISKYSILSNQLELSDKFYLLQCVLNLAIGIYQIAMYRVHKCHIWWILKKLSSFQNWCVQYLCLHAKMLINWTASKKNYCTCIWHFYFWVKPVLLWRLLYKFLTCICIVFFIFVWLFKHGWWQ